MLKCFATFWARFLWSLVSLDMKVVGGGWHGLATNLTSFCRFAFTVIFSHVLLKKNNQFTTNVANLGLLLLFHAGSVTIEVRSIDPLVTLITELIWFMLPLVIPGLAGGHQLSTHLTCKVRGPGSPRIELCFDLQTLPPVEFISLFPGLFLIIIFLSSFTL